MKHNEQWLQAVLVIVATFAAVSFAEDWPTYMHDMQRSGVTPMTLNTPLYLEWKHVPGQPPRPAWPEPAKQDYWNQVRELSPVVVYDRAYHVVCVGDAVYYGSSADDQVYCLDAATGVLRWRFFTEGPVRLAPTVADGRVYFSSDDGCAYCLDAKTGALVWRYSPAELDRRLPGNSRIISYAPARTGVVVDAGVAYFFSGLFPPAQTYKCALDAATGNIIHSKTVAGVSPQGYLLASSTRLFVPTGRTAPFMFERDTLANQGALQGPGGAYALLVDDALVSGTGVRDVNRLYYTAQETRERIASFPGLRMLVHEGIAYLQSPNEVSALDRRRYLDFSVEINRRTSATEELRKQLRALARDDADERTRVESEIALLNDQIKTLEEEREGCYLWKRPAGDPFSMILAGDILFMGGQDRLYALRKSNGEELWRYDVEGRIYGLAAANGLLYASSSTGYIYCFSQESAASGRVAEMPKGMAPYVSNEQERIAHEILKDSGITQGYCLVSGTDAEQLAYALAMNSALRVIVAEADEGRAAAARAALADTGLYGTRIAVHRVNGASLPYTTYLANLIVASDTCSAAPEEIYRVLRPYGGKAYLHRDSPASGMHEQLLACAVTAQDMLLEQEDWLVLTRGVVPGAGEWTQLYADASHTAYSGDGLDGPVTVQWFGDPGPREMVDRHHRPMSALFQKARLFVTANNKVIALDGYNGFPLWELEAPDSRRIGAMKNSGHQLLADDHLYIVREDECWVVDVETGARERVVKAPQPSDSPMDWGYLNSISDVLIGSGQAQDASFEKMSKAMVNILEGDYRPVIMSEYLFALDRATGKQKWLYRNGRFLNAMIAASEGRVYCVESRNAVAMAN
ncbi:MAG TPA: hypothetical protein ENN29_05755, partial [Candidatus Hydrogenedentes bacterium]|nr:hypothetical protein [Candidatus Hydrogenedentota bacterium]